MAGRAVDGSHRGAGDLGGAWGEESSGASDRGLVDVVIGFMAGRGDGVVWRRGGGIEGACGLRRDRHPRHCADETSRSFARPRKTRAITLRGWIGAAGLVERAGRRRRRGGDGRQRIWGWRGAWGGRGNGDWRCDSDRWRDGGDCWRSDGDWWPGAGRSTGLDLVAPSNGVRRRRISALVVADRRHRRGDHACDDGEGCGAALLESKGRRSATGPGLPPRGQLGGRDCPAVGVRRHLDLRRSSNEAVGRAVDELDEGEGGELADPVAAEEVGDLGDTCTGEDGRGQLLHQRVSRLDIESHDRTGPRDAGALRAAVEGRERRQIVSQLSCRRVPHVSCRSSRPPRGSRPGRSYPSAGAARC